MFLQLLNKIKRTEFKIRSKNVGSPYRERTHRSGDISELDFTTFLLALLEPKIFNVNVGTVKAAYCNYYKCYQPLIVITLQRSYLLKKKLLSSVNVRDHQEAIPK